MGIKLFGISGSRAIRSIWAAEETEIDYEHVATHFVKDSKAEEYLQINPNGRIPALADGDLLLCESMAINLYPPRIMAATSIPIRLPERRWPGSGVFGAYQK